LTSEAVTLDPSGVNGAVNYGYDSVCNRTRRQSTLGGVPTSAHVYDSRDRMDVLVAYSYDNNGNTTAAPGGISDTYDFEDRLTGRTAGATTTMVYDGGGNRGQKDGQRLGARGPRMIAILARCLVQPGRRLFLTIRPDHRRLLSIPVGSYCGAAIFARSFIPPVRHERPDTACEWLTGCYGSIP
jgi:hypothetical protein